ncbi:MAG: TolC family protein, partial [candidate division Zixibacteria bacterium]
LATIQRRIDKGAALQSELLLARLEHQRAELARVEAATALTNARDELTCMWTMESTEVLALIPAEPDLESIVDQISLSLADSTRELIALANRQRQLEAERALASVETKPNLTLSSGFKRLTADKSNSFLFGFSLPLPLKSQNRGTLKNLDAEISRVDYDVLLARRESVLAVRSGIARLQLLVSTHTALQDELLPTADEAYRTMQDLYQSGRLPYTSLLEANRSLVELRFEHNDILLAFSEQLIALERVGGMILQPDEDF